MQALTPTLSRFAVEGAIEFARCCGVLCSARKEDSEEALSLAGPLYREAGEGGGEGLPPLPNRCPP